MAHKRQRTENGGEQFSSHVAGDEFHVTFGVYGSIKLSKGALQNFPTSLLPITLLGDGIEEHHLYLPIGCGHKSFPELIEDVFNLGAPLDIPPLGLPFDLFVKWLKYLGLATPGRGLSIERQAHKRVSFFVETILSNVRSGHCGAVQPRPPRIVESSCSSSFINMPADIKRFLSDLVPFEFARRGIHVTIKELPERNVKIYDMNLSKVGPYPHAIGGEVLIRRSLWNEPGSVTGVYMCDVNQKSPFAFEHGGHPYELSWSSELDGDGYAAVTLVQLDAGCCYDGRANIERVVVVRRHETDFAAEFKSGKHMVYSPEEHGDAFLGNVEREENVLRPYLLIHGMTVYLPNLTDEDFEGACLLVVENESLPLCEYDWELADRDDVRSVVWRFSLEESPEWALQSDGEPPLP